jgi:hypothetical protein
MVDGSHRMDHQFGGLGLNRKLPNKGLDLSQLRAGRFNRRLFFTCNYGMEKVAATGW